MGRQLVLAALMLLTSGCATLMTGTHQKVEVTTRPDGAQVRVDGGKAQRAPVVLVLSKRKSHLLEVRAPGHRPQDVVLQREVQWLVLGDVFALILPGLIIDFATGGAFALPRTVRVVLEPAGGEVAP